VEVEVTRQSAVQSTYQQSVACWLAIIKLTGALLIVLCILDAGIFRSGLYVRIVSLESSAGRVLTALRVEEARKLNKRGRVLILGNSQLAEGFSTATAGRALEPLEVRRL
jgi:hypothetical protein